MHVLLLTAVAIALLGWLAYRTVRHVKDKRHLDREKATDPKPDGRDRSPES